MADHPEGNPAHPENAKDNSELEQKLNEAMKKEGAPNEGHQAAHDKKEAKPKSMLESVIGEASHLFGNAAKLGLAAALPITQATMLPTFARDTAILTGAQVASDYTTALQRGKKYTAGNILESAAIGTAITVPLETMFRAANSIPGTGLTSYLYKGALWGGICYPIFNGLYLTTAYLIRNRTFKGMGKYLKENYWPVLKKSWKYLLPFSLLNVFFAPAYLQIPIAATLSFIYDRFTAQKGDFPEDQKRDKTPYLVAAPNVVYKLARNTGKGLYDAAYAIGASIGNLFKSAPKTSKPVGGLHPAPAGAHA